MRQKGVKEMFNSIPAKFGRKSCGHFWVGFGATAIGLAAVSYTHLTLPTILLV